MKQYFNLLNTISQEYNIKRGDHEDELSWKLRIIYSFLSQVGYSALYDVQENLEPSSIVHFKRRIKETFSSLTAMYPELEAEVNIDSLTDEIYNNFFVTGCIYHEPSRITPCIRHLSFGREYSFLRGQSLDEKKWLSGMGCYYPSERVLHSPKEEKSFNEFFCLQQKPLSQIWLLITEKARFTPIASNIDVEYLKVAPPYKTGYWTNIPDDSGDISLARSTTSGKYIYFLYKYTENKMLISQLPEWMTSEANYRSISVACLKSRDVLPEISFHVDGEIATVNFGYLLPPTELNVIKLYSWPTLYLRFPNDFNRIMNVNVFNELRTYFEKAGYQFKEE